jgi:signal transduction histidine kinase
MARLAAAHRPRLSFALSADDDPGAAEISRGADAGAATPRYVGCVRGRRIPRASRLGDLVLAFGLALLALVEIWWPGGLVATGPIEGNKAVLVPTALAMTLPLAYRRRWPLATVLVVFGAAALQELLTTPVDGIAGVAAHLVASYSVAAYSERPPAIFGLAAALALSLSSGIGDAVFAAVLIGSAWGAGRIVRRQNHLLDALAVEQAARERAAVADERARLARELHDVVAHSVSTMVVQAEAGESLLGRDPERAREAFVSITSSGRQALGELRRMLGLLRKPDGERPLDPQPGLGQLEALVGQMREIGLPVELTIEGQARPLPGGVDLSAYRIVQEALTNTLKHAGPAHACVTVRYRVDGVELEVVDDGRGSTNGSRDGHGIRGMRERVRLYGGTLETGRRNDGGFTVRARLPSGTA